MINKRKYIFAGIMLGLIGFILLNLYFISASSALGNCDTISTANTVFVLNTSISNSGATCLTISAQNITIDCNGFNITGDNTGSSTAGILSNQFNTTIRN